MRYYAYRFNVQNGQLEYLGCVGKFEYNGDAMAVAAERWPDFIAERIGPADDMPGVQVKPETDPYVQQLLAKQG